MHLGWPSRHWRSLAISMALAAIVGGCASGPASGTPSPAATGSGAPRPSYIVAASPTAPVAAPSTAAPSPGGSASPSAAAIQLTGTYEASLDITTTSSTGKVHTTIHQTGSVTAAGAADGTLTGTATYTYRKDYSIGGPGCKLAWSTGDVTWDSAVTGTWQANVDGSVAVSLLPAANQGARDPRGLPLRRQGLRVSGCSPVHRVARQWNLRRPPGLHAHEQRHRNELLLGEMAHRVDAAKLTLAKLRRRTRLTLT